MKLKRLKLTPRQNTRQLSVADLQDGEAAKMRKVHRISFQEEVTYKATDAIHINNSRNTL